MSWLSRVLHGPTPPATPPLTDLERLSKVGAAWREAEREFNTACQTLKAYRQTYKDPRQAFLRGDLYVRLNAMRLDPERQRLESVLALSAEKRNRLLAERKDLMLKLRIIR